MLKGEATRKAKKSDMSNQQKTTTFHVQYTFLHISLPLLLHDYYVKLPSYMFYGGNFVCAHKKFICLCSCPLFFHFR